MVDALFVSVRRDTVAEEVVLVVLDITESGQREFLDFEVAPAESAQGWYALFQRLYRRGLREVLLVVSNGLTGLEEGADLQGSAPTVQGDRWPLADGRRLSANGTCPWGERSLRGFREDQEDLRRMFAQCYLSLHRNLDTTKFASPFWNMGQ